MEDVRLTFDDGSVVRLCLEPGTGALAHDPGVDARAVEHDGAATHELDLPPGFGGARPVSSDGRAAQALTRSGQTLSDALRPLGGVLSSIHNSVSQFAQRPDDVTVEFGVTLGSDLSLGVFSGSGEASFTVSATWNLNGTGEAASTAPPGGLPSQVNGS
ncbi:CU044_2847 family protein [Streptomyces parvus]|uniref:CU044_2847 family protein n=1 Tax=Streptomyces parvus TaxID=66428 RepID=UPI003438966E